MEQNPCLIGILTRDLCGEDVAHVSIDGIEVIADNATGRGGLRGSRGSRVMVVRSDDRWVLVSVQPHRGRCSDCEVMFSVVWRNNGITTGIRYCPFCGAEVEDIH